MNKSPENTELVKSFDREHDTLYVFKYKNDKDAVNDVCLYTLCDKDADGNYRALATVNAKDVSICQWAWPENGFSLHDMVQFLHIVDNDF
jgi:proline dehydrogenase